jgi:hypothetical protein
VPLTAPTKSIIALYASVSDNDSISLLATVTEEAGTPVQNGTLVTFTTTLGSLDPSSARTTNGQVTARLFSKDLSGQAISGEAIVSAFSGGATAGSGTTAGNAATVKVTLGNPPSIPSP